MHECMSGVTPDVLTCPSSFLGQGTCAGIVWPCERPGAPCWGKAPQSPCPERYPSGTPKGEVGAGGCSRVARSCGGEGCVSGAAGRHPQRGTGRPATQPGQLPPLTRASFLHSCQSQAWLGDWDPGREIPTPCSALPRAKDAQCGCGFPGACNRAGPCPPHTCGSHRGPLRPSGFSCCLQDLISAWTSLTSRRFFLLLLECARLA